MNDLGVPGWNDARSGSRGPRTRGGRPEGRKDPPIRRGPWGWIAVLLLGIAGGYLAGLSSRDFPLGLATGPRGSPMSPSSARADDTDRMTVRTGLPSTSALAAVGREGDATPAGVPTRLEYLQGDGQTARAGTTLPGPYGVQVLDAYGGPVSGVQVRFQVVAGGGVVDPPLAPSDSLGRATTAWRLGSSPGFHRLTATSPELETVVTFTATAQAPDDVPWDPQAGNPQGRDGRLPESPGREIVDRPPWPTTPRSEAVRVVPRDFVIGGSTVCELTDEGVTCRGANDRGQRIRGAATGTRALAAGLFHACALDAAGTASCWGANDAAQLGDGTHSDRNRATPVATDLRFSALGAGLAHTCGLTAWGQLACWGQNHWGQLGDGSRLDHMTPVPVSTPAFVALESGWNHTCAFTESGTLYCWGLNSDGQVGDGTRLDRRSPKRVATSVRSVAAGSSHTCALIGEAVLCWGDNRFGQLGDGTTESSLRSTPVLGLPDRATALVSGAAHTCVLLADGEAYCWGQNLHGQLGNGSTVNASTPTPVAGGLTFLRLSAGGAVTCGVSVEGTEYCWGLNQSGQLGDGSHTSRALPARVGS